MPDFAFDAGGFPQANENRASSQAPTGSEAGTNLSTAATARAYPGCDQCLLTKQDFEVHFFTHHPCLYPNCGYRATGFDELLTHLRMHQHDQGPTTSVSDTQEAVTPFNAVGSAVSTDSHHTGSPSPDNPVQTRTRVPCPAGCGDTFARQCDARRHARKHGDKKLVCGIDGCEMAFHRRDNREVHRCKKH
ncbi:MAG: hypothetical protein MMC23_004602 [Stictis urceolatum]|nr:hypothetical protein [Stictis urceolata]